MGYTHYFTIKEVPPQELQDNVLRAAKAIVDKAKTELGLAIEDLSDKEIYINSMVSPDHETLYIARPSSDCETFYVDFNRPGFGFCKTNLKPYDAVVVAILCAMDAIMGDYVDIGSDGDTRDWQKGQALAIDALSAAIDLPDSIPTY